MIRMLPLAVDRQMFCLYDDARLIAKCLYSTEESELYSVEVLDAAVADPWIPSLIKATLSSMDYAGVTRVRCKNPELFPVLETLRFSKNGEGEMSVSLEGYFACACECASCAKKDSCDSCK